MDKFKIKLSEYKRVFKKCDACLNNSKELTHIYCDDTDIMKLCFKCLKELKAII